MISTSKAAEAYNVLNKLDDGASLKGTVKIFIHDKEGNDVGVMDLYEGFEIGGGEYDDSFLNQSLNTAKKIFSRLAAGDVNYKIGKIAFGNAGHNFANTKQAGAVSEENIELNAAELIKANLGTADEYTYETGGNTFRLVYIEKTIGVENVTFGENNDQFIVRVPVSFDEFNMRVDDPGATTDSAYTDTLVEYDLIADDGSLIQMGNADSDGAVVAGKTHTEVLSEAATTTFLFKNGLDANGDVDAVNGGYRPQEISEILLLTDIIGNGTTEPYQKLAASRMTSGLLSFPEGFQFTYEWTLTWNFQ